MLIIHRSTFTLAFFSLLLPSLGAWADTNKEKQRCTQLYNLSSYETAGKCFEKLAQAMGPPNKLAPQKKASKGRLLRNGALSFDKAARKEKRVEVAAYLREHAVKLLAQYLKEKLWDDPSVPTSALAHQAKIKAQIGYANLTLLCGHKDATFVLKGYLFKVEGKQNLSQAVRPGPYVLKIAYPDGKTKTDAFEVKPGKSLIKSYQAPKKVVVAKVEPKTRTDPKVKSQRPKDQRSEERKIARARMLAAQRRAQLARMARLARLKRRRKKVSGLWTFGLILATAVPIGAMAGSITMFIFASTGIDEGNKKWQSRSADMKAALETGQKGMDSLTTGLAISGVGVGVMLVGIIIVSVTKKYPAQTGKGSSLTLRPESAAGTVTLIDASR